MACVNRSVPVHIVQGLENTGVYKAGEGSKEGRLRHPKFFFPPEFQPNSDHLDQETTLIIEATKLAEDLAKKRHRD